MLYSIIQAVCEPLPLAMLLLGVAIVVVVRRSEGRRWPARLLLGSYFFLLILSLPVTAYWAAASLEWVIPREGLAGAPQAIVILGGYVRGPGAPAIEVRLGEDVVYRCLVGLRVAAAQPELPIVVSGGPVGNYTDGTTHAQVMDDFLREHGLANREIWREDRSRTTHENAMYTTELLRAQQRTRIVLVTDGTHMMRAVRCFRHEGLEVQPMSSRTSVASFEWSIHALIPNPSALLRMHEVAHEWLGLLWYSFRGYC